MYYKRLEKKLRFLILLGFSLIAINSFSQEYLVIEYSDFKIGYSPNGVFPDTLVKDIKEGMYKNHTIHLVIFEPNGKSVFKLFDSKTKILRVEGEFNKAIDTLKRYSGARIMGKPYGVAYFRTTIQEYLEPLSAGIWKFYNAKGKFQNQIKFIHEFH